MKNYLTTPIGEMISNTGYSAGNLDIDGQSQKIGIKSILLKNKKSFTWIFFQVIALLFMFSTANAQVVENLETYLSQVDAREATHINMLVNNSPSTLLIYNQIYEMDGESPMMIADVHLNSLEELYGDYPEFENVQLIRIKVRNEEDLDFNLELDELKSFTNLRYIYVIITYEMCPPNGRNFDCEKERIKQLFTTSQSNSSSFNIEPEGNNTPVILFKVVRLS